MKPSLFIIISVMPLMALADNTLPKHPDFNRYRTMLNRSFASARTAPADKHFKNISGLNELISRWSAPQ